MRVLEHEDQNYGRRPKLFAYGGTADRILTVLDLSPALDLPETSAEVTAMLRQIFAEHGILRRAYVKGRPSNTSGNNPFYLTTDPFTQQQKEIPLVARTMGYVERKTRLKIARVSLNLHSPGAIQGEHSDYSSVTGELTGRAVVPMAPVGSSRTFVVTDEEGNVLRSYEINSSTLVALLMRHKTRGELFGMSHGGGRNCAGPSFSLVFTFTTDFDDAPYNRLVGAGLLGGPIVPVAYQLGADVRTALDEIVRAGPGLKCV